MTTEAERLASELVGGYLEPTLLESAAAALLRSQAAEIERLTAEAELFSKHIGLKLARKDALLREAVRAMKYHTDQTRPIESTFDTMDKIKTELGEQT